MLNTHLMRLISHYLDIIKTPPHVPIYEAHKQPFLRDEKIYNKESPTTKLK